MKIVSKERFCSHGLSSKEPETKILLYKPAMGSIFDFIQKIQLLLKNRTLFSGGQGSHSEHPYDVLVKILQKQKPLSYQCLVC